MLPTVLAGERGWFPCDRCRMHAATSKQARCRFTTAETGGGEGERKEQRTKERQNNQVMSKNMQNHKNQCDSEH